MLMRRFAICTNTLPTTCFETSKNHIFIGLCGRSLHRLYTSANKAQHPNAACTRIANDPNSLHSPFGGGGGPPWPAPWGGGGGWFGDWETAVAVAMAAAMLELEENASTAMGSTEVAVAIADDRRAVGEAFSRRETTEGSKPGGGSISSMR